MAGQLKVNGVTLATEESGTVTLENPQIKDSSNNLVLDQSGSRPVLKNVDIKDSSNNLILDQSGTNPVLKNVEVVNNSSMMFRNRIINGDMRIDQRNAGGSLTPTDGQYSVDRWKSSLNVASKFSLQQSSTAPSGFSNSLLATSLSSYSVGAGEVTGVQQIIEGLNVADLAWGTASAKNVKLSFWVRSSLTGTFAGSLRNSASNRSYPFSYTISSADTWEQKTLTIAGDTSGTWLTTNGIGIALYFAFGAGSTFSSTAGSWQTGNYISATGATSLVGTSGATWYITGVQLEVGTVATPFEHRPYGVELALCQRYFQKSYDIETAVGSSTFTGASQWRNVASNGGIFLRNTDFLQVRMRSTPTFTFYTTGGTAGSINSFDGTDRTHTVSSVDKPSTRGFGGINITGTGVPDNAEYYYQYTALAEL